MPGAEEGRGGKTGGGVGGGDHRSLATPGLKLDPVLLARHSCPFAYKSGAGAQPTRVWPQMFETASHSRGAALRWIGKKLPIFRSLRVIERRYLTESESSNYH